MYTTTPSLCPFQLVHVEDPMDGKLRYDIRFGKLYTLIPLDVCAAHTHTHVENILTIGKHPVMHVVSNFKTPAAHLHPLDLDIHFCTHADPITSVKFSQDGHCQLVSSLDNNIRLLDKDSGELLNTLVLTHTE